MTDRHAPGRNALQEEPPEGNAGTRCKIVSLRTDQKSPPPERLDPRLEEMRRILAESKPLDSLYSDDEVIASPNLVTAPAKAIKPVLALLGLFAFCCGLYWMYVKPWLLRRRKERQQGLQQAAAFPVNRRAR